MKRFIFLLLSLTMLCSCTNIYNDEIDSSKPDKFKTSGTLSFIETRELISQSDTGAYYMDRTENSDWNIRYIDYDTNIDTLLCNRPECTHQDASCSAFIKYTGNVYSILSSKDKLFLFSTLAEDPWINKYGESALSKISVLSKNGENRKDIITFAPNQTTLSAKASDDEHIYTLLMETTINQNTKNTDVKTFLVAINLHSGKMTKLMDYSNSFPWIKGVYEDNIIVVTNKSEMTSDGINSYEELHYYNINSCTDSVLYTTKQNQHIETVGSNIYLVDRFSGITFLNTDFKGENTIYPAGGKKEFKTVDLLEAKDNFLIAFENYDNSYTTNFFIINLNENNVQPFKLHYIYENTMYGKDVPPIDIKLSTSNGYLVQIGYKSKEISYVDPLSSSIRKFLVEEPIFAFISFSDLLTSTPNYQYINKI